MKAALFLVLAVLTVRAAAQSTISAADKYSHAANAGWIDFRPSAADGVRFTDTFLSGKAYAANIGWIDFGDGSPDNGHTYGNTTATDCGVNLSTAGDLTGYAYSANAGWITFDPAAGHPNVNYLTGRVAGLAYSANLGWINLEATPAVHLATATIACPDTDADGVGDAFEMLYFHNLTRATATTDSDHDGSSDLAESIANTDPLDPWSRLDIISQAYGQFNTPGTKSLFLQFTSSPSRLYTIQKSTDLTVWLDSGLGLVPGAPGSATDAGFTFTDGPRYFFRIVPHKPLP